MPWIWSLQELRVTLAVRLDTRSPVSAAPVQPPNAPIKLQLWLSGVIGTLAETSGLPLIFSGPYNDHRSLS
jgi:hypothetical protein